MEAACKRTVLALLIASVVGSAGTAGAAAIDLASHWPAEGDANDAAGTNHGTLTNGAGFSPGIIGLAFALDGVNDYIVVNSATSIPVGNDVSTVTAWVQFDEVDVLDPAAQPIILWGTATFHSMRLLFLRFGKLGRAYFGNDHTSDFTPIVGQWYHIAWVFDGNGNADRLYVNGLLVHSVVVNNVNTSGTDIYIGRYAPNASHFDGLIDEVKIWAKALSDAEILDEAAPPVPGAGRWALVTLTLVLAFLACRSFKLRSFNHQNI